MQTYRRQNSRPFDPWQRVGVPKTAMKRPGYSSYVGDRFVQIEFDTTAPGNERGVTARVDLSVDDMLEHLSTLLGGDMKAMIHMAKWIARKQEGEEGTEI